MPDDSSDGSSTDGSSDDSAAVTVFLAGDDGVDTYRIPALTVTSEGTLLAFAEARTVSALDGDPHGLVVRRSEDGGKTWEPARTIAPYDAEGGCAPSDPAPIALSAGADAGHVVLLYRSCRSGAALPGVLRSEDDGRAWSSPATVPVATDDGRVPSGGVGTGPGHGIELSRGEHAGRLVVAAHGALAGLEHLFLLLSDDGGRSWRIGASVAEPAGGDPDIDEPAVTETPDGSLLVSSRSASGGRTQARSLDGGSTFAAGQDGEVGEDGEVLEARPELTNPVVQGSLTTLDEPELTVFVSPSDPVDRRGLRLWRSADGGRTWEEGPLLVRGVAAYSDLVVLADDGMIGLLVETGDRHPFERIDLLMVPLERVGDAPDPLPEGFDTRTAVAGRIVVDDERYLIRSLCVTTEMVARVEAEGVRIEADISGGLSDVPITARLERPSPEPELVVDGRVTLDVAAGISFRGPLEASDGSSHQVDFVLVNTSPAVLQPTDEC